MKPNLTDMRKEPKKGDMMPHAMEGEVEDYPYGLCIHLEKEQIDALNLSEMPEPGDSYKILATGVVTKSAMQPGGKDPSISIQLTAIQLISDEDEREENEEEPEKRKGPSTILGNSYRNYD